MNKTHFQQTLDEVGAQAQKEAEVAREAREEAAMQAERVREAVVEMERLRGELAVSAGRGEDGGQGTAERELMW
jgi:methyl-accepting chemotaxis protein